MENCYLTTSTGKTKKLGEIYGKKILRSLSKRKAIIFGLVGSLGSGKTTFLQGLARGLGVKTKVTSPTFVIIRKHKTSDRRPKSFKYFYHIDCYRLQKPKEILRLGFKEIIADPQNIVMIEWAEKIKKTLHKDIIWIKFESQNRNRRRIIFKKRLP